MLEWKTQNTFSVAPKKGLLIKAIIIFQVKNFLSQSIRNNTNCLLNTNLWIIEVMSKNNPSLHGHQCDWLHFAGIKHSFLFELWVCLNSRSTYWFQKSLKTTKKNREKNVWKVPKILCNNKLKSLLVGLDPKICKNYSLVYKHFFSRPMSRDTRRKMTNYFMSCDWKRTWKGLSALTQVPSKPVSIS